VVDPPAGVSVIVFTRSSTGPVEDKIRLRISSK
jgi:hypothetical protein